MPRQKVLVIDDDPGAIKTMSRILAGLADVQFATNGEDAIRLMRESLPALVLLDAEMPGMSGFQLCDLIKADETLADVPVIFVTSHCEPEFEIAGFEIGAVDFIAKPVSPPLLAARVKTQLRIQALAEDVRRISTVDSLTEIMNRRAFDELLQREWRRTRRARNPVSLILVDVDHFKLYNDRYGNPAGDRCLQAIAGALSRACLRPADTVARYGGEEFALLLPETPRAGAEHVAMRILQQIEALGIAHAASLTSSHVTASVGLSSYDRDAADWIDSPAESRFVEESAATISPQTLRKAADNALYAAKHAGRAQAWLLDHADVEVAGAAREIMPPASGKREVSHA